MTDLELRVIELKKSEEELLDNLVGKALYDIDWGEYGNT